MNNKKGTKRALLTSVMALAMCVVMLIGTTFAWFTDTATANVNRIQSGTLDVDIVNEAGESLEGQTLKFTNKFDDANILWEPGATFDLDSFKIVNKGNLALQYKITVSGVTGSAKLLEAIDFTAKVGNDVTALNALTGILLPEGAALADPATEKAGSSDLITISGTMKTTAGNEYQNLTLDGIAITVTATQYTYEYDSSTKDYDATAKAEFYVNPTNIQDYLDGKYGSIDGMTLVLADGDYGKLYLGRATAYAGSNTKYYTFKGGYAEQQKIREYATAEEHKTTLADTSTYHGYIKYIRSLNNVTFKAAGDNVSIAGISMESGHISSTGDYNYVLGCEVVNGVNGYFLVHRVSGLTFEGLKFTDKVNIATSLEETIIDGVTFNNCAFTTNGTDSAKGQALRYYNENANGNVRNLTVNECQFTNCYQPVYTGKVCGVKVTDCQFTTVGHAAISVQNSGKFDHRAVVVTGNTFNNGTAVAKFIRFNEIGADTQITVKNNTVTGNFDGDAFAIKATSVAQGVTKDISGNNWGSLPQDIVTG